MSPITYCPKCGKSNDENNYKCTRCEYTLQGTSQNIVLDDNTMGGLIPYKNAKALWSYYVGIFSLIPCLGIPLAIAALILGNMGLKHAKKHPESKGAKHAWFGILSAAFSLVYHVVFFYAISTAK